MKVSSIDAQTDMLAWTDERISEDLTRMSK